MVCELLALAGLVVGVVVGRASAGTSARGVAKKVIKGGYATGRVIKAVASEAKEEVSEIAAKAKAEIKNLAEEDEKPAEARSPLILTANAPATTAPAKPIIIP